VLDVLLVRVGLDNEMPTWRTGRPKIIFETARTLDAPNLLGDRSSIAGRHRDIRLLSHQVA
jgi:hypothetical protein